MTTAAKAIEQGPTLRIREMQPGDVNFVASRWKRSFYNASTWCSGMRWQVFLRGHGPIIDELLKTAKVLVASDPDVPDSDQVLGFLVFSLEPGPVVHYAYTKPPFEGMGIFGTLLLASGLPQRLEGVSVTHITRSWIPDRRTGQEGLKSRFPGATFDPYLWPHTRS